ncbi:MAG: hypothetical protein E4H01_10745 [Lysobacterales bacterium]|nr:MAG: hypothetical protein E4H01_10745 [Xanthomonadales bacterium]
MNAEFTLKAHDHGPNGASYIMRYSADDMLEVFTNEQREHLATGGMIITKGSSIVDLEAFFIANNRFGVAA